MGERFISPIHYQWFIYKEIQKVYNKLSSTSYPRTNLISTLFPISFHKQETQWFHSPNVFSICFPTLNLWFPKDLFFWLPKTHPSLSEMTLIWSVYQSYESLSKRHRPSPKSSLFWFSKIHILKFWTSLKDLQPLVFKYPKSLLLWFPWDSPSLLNKFVKGCLYTVKVQAKPRHDLPKLFHD